MSSAVSGAQVGSEWSLEVGRRATVGRRLASGVVDALALFAGFALIFGTELLYATDEKVDWAVAAWMLGFSPLYFALYHAYGRGATPGQIELRIGLRDTRVGRCASLSRSLVRAYVGLGFLLLGVPALLDLVVLLASGRSLRDRMTRTVPMAIALKGTAPELAGATAPELAPLFEPEAGTRRYLRRGWSLLSARPRLILGSVAALYAVLLAIGAILAFLLVGDSLDPWGIDLAYFLLSLLVLLASGAYWTQAVIVTAVEEARVGAEASVWATLARASRRANALSIALVLLLAFAALGSFVLLPLFVVGRLSLVAPALVLEDRRVLGSFQRSWQLTKGMTWRTFGFVLLSGGMLVVLASVELAVAGAIIGDVTAVSWLIVALLSLLGIAIAVVPVVVALAWLGAAWSLLYEDARRAHPPEGVR